MKIEKYKKFDWELLENNPKSNPEKTKYLKSVFNLPITEEEFVDDLQDLKMFSRGRKTNYSPSNLKAQYKHLKKNFGFFPQPSKKKLV